MLDRIKLQNSIKAGIHACEDAKRAAGGVNVPAQDQYIRERDELVGHLNLAEAAGNDKVKLEEVMRSLEYSSVRAES